MVREFEYQVRTRDGSILWLSDSAGAVRNEAGVIVRYEGVVRDITEEKRAEDAIAEGRRLLQQVIDTVPAVINVKDKKLQYVLMNRYMKGARSISPRPRTSTVSVVGADVHNRASVVAMDRIIDCRCPHGVRHHLKPRNQQRPQHIGVLSDDIAVTRRANGLMGTGGLAKYLAISERGAY